MPDWNHDSLQEDLAGHLRHGGERFTWCNMAILGEARPDVFTLRPFSQTQPELISYEVKVTREDLRRDLTSGKWQKYLEFSQAVTFAVPHGLAKPGDIPKGCGLILRGPKMWRHVRKPVLERAKALPIGAMIRLISARPNMNGRRGSMLHGAQYAGERWQEEAAERQIYAAAREKIGKRLGQAIAKYLEKPEAAENILKDAKERADKILKTAKHDYSDRMNKVNELWSDLAHSVGLPRDTNRRYVVQARVREIIERLNRDLQISALREGLEKIQKALAEAQMLDHVAKQQLEKPDDEVN